jgi:hypothetical protein
MFRSGPFSGSTGVANLVSPPHQKERVEILHVREELRDRPGNPERRFSARSSANFERLCHETLTLWLQLCDINRVRDDVIHREARPIGGRNMGLDGLRCALRALRG